MSTNKMKRLAILGLFLGLLGSTGTGIYLAKAQEKPTAKTAAKAAAATSRTAATTKLLELDAGFEKNDAQMTLGALLEQLGEKSGLTILADEQFFHDLGVDEVYDQKIRLRIARGLSIRDVLEEACRQLVRPSPGVKPTGILVKGNQVILGRGSPVLAVPGRGQNGDSQLMVDEPTLAEVLSGPAVSLAVENMPLAEVVNLLREKTGANLVVDTRLKEQMQQPITLTLNETRLMAVLKVVGDMHDMAPAIVGNVYYLTSKPNADKLTRELYVELYGMPQVPKLD